MKRKLFLGLLLAVITFAFLGCSTSSGSSSGSDSDKDKDNTQKQTQTDTSKETAPIINEVLFINSSLDNCWTYTTYSAESKPTALTSLDIYSADELHKLQTPPYYVYIAFIDKDKDIKAFNEVSIPDTGMKGTNEMPSEKSYVIIPVGYTTTEIPSEKITNGKYTFKFQAEDSKGNKSNVFEVTVDASFKK